MTTFIFGPYFISRMAENPEAGRVAWGYGFAAAGFLIAVLSPIPGAVADRTGARKPRIAFFAVLKIIGLCLLWFAVPGANLFWVLCAFSMAMVAAEFSIVFNDSMMPRLVPSNDIGRVSNIARGLGYLGGMIVLIFVVLCLAASPETGTTIIGMKPLFGLDPVLGRMRALPDRWLPCGISFSSCQCFCSRRTRNVASLCARRCALALQN